MMENNFAWKRTHQNVFIGYPNDGKTAFTLFLMVIKSLYDGWKWVVWSPEMKSASFMNNKIEINYNDLINDIVWSLSGKTPYKHIAEKYNQERVNIQEYLAHCEWVKEHFVFIEPKDRRPQAIMDLLAKIHAQHGFDGTLIDPFKNIKQEIRERDDIYLQQLFSDTKDFAVETNSVLNWIAHPKANVQRIVDQTLMPCDQYMISGGAAWDQSMDGIYSVFRPNLLDDIRDPNVWFLNLKQRKQALVAERGTVKDIYLDIRQNRYIFGLSNYDPIYSYLFTKQKP
jgi:twinkle protein